MTDRWGCFIINKGFVCRMCIENSFSEAHQSKKLIISKNLPINFRSFRSLRFFRNPKPSQSKYPAYWD